MRSRCLAGFLAIGALAPAAADAAQSYVVPITVVPGTVRIQNTTPASLPFAVPIPSSNCPGSNGTFAIEVVNGGLEVSFAGFVPPPTVPEWFTCHEAMYARMEVELQVPEVGGSGTLIRLDVEPMSSNFSSIHGASAGLSLAGLIRSSSVTGLIRPPQLHSYVTWNSSGLMPYGAQMDLVNWIPGDTVRFPIDVSAGGTGSTIAPMQGSFRARFVFRVTVPEPSAPLSLPIGALGLAGLASLRAGGN